MNRLLPDELVVVHETLSRCGIPHAFGGAVALAFYGLPRYTHDLDINIALDETRYPTVLDCLASLFPIDDREKAGRELRSIGQTRLRWGALPIDLFLQTTPFHTALAERTLEAEYAGARLPIITPDDLVVLKSAFNRGKDWLDIEAMFQVLGRSLDTEHIVRWVSTFSEPDDERMVRLRRLILEYGRQPP